MKKIIQLFESGNVSVSGLRGRGKDLLMANVAVRRGMPYVSNIDYGGQHIEFHPEDIDCGQNTYYNFIRGQVNQYVYPFPEGTDIYISDAGIYFPAQYTNELNKHYGYFSTFMALSRHVGNCNVHFNSQNLNRVWDKIREQSDIYITCNRCLVLFGKIVFQKVTIYEKYDSAVSRVPPYRPPKAMFGASKVNVELEAQRYKITYGDIQRRMLVYIHKSPYDTRRFKAMLENGKPRKAPAERKQN